MDSTSLPTLFGRATTISSQHDRLNLTLDRLRRMSAAIDTGSEFGSLSAELEPSALLELLRSQLERHFSAEEASSYFGTVASERPALLPQIAGLRADHAAMLERLQQLLALAKERQRWLDLAWLTRQLIAQLEAHEHLETALMQDFILREDGGGNG